MKKRHGLRIIFFLLSLNLFFSNPAKGKSMPLGIKDLFKLALNNPQIKEAKEIIYQAEKNKEKAFSFFLPRLTLDFKYNRRPEALYSSGFLLRSQAEERFQVILKQPLYSGGKHRASLKIARKGIHLAREDLKLAKEELLFEVAEAYYTILKSKKNIELLNAEIKRLEEQRRQTKNRFKVGEVTKNVLLRTEAELSGAKVNLLKAKNSLNLSRDKLASLTGIEGNYELKERKVIPKLFNRGVNLPPLFSEEELFAKAFKQRSDLKKIEISRQMLEGEIKVVKSSFLPTLNLELFYSYLNQSPSGSFLIQDEYFTALALNLPFYEGGQRKAELAEARSKLRQAELNRLLLEEKIKLELKRVNLELIELNSTLDNLKDKVNFARENYEIINRQFRAGAVTPLEVMDANSLLREAESQLSSAFYDRELAIIRLKKALGTLLEEAE